MNRLITILSGLFLAISMPAQAQWGMSLEQQLERARGRESFNMVKENWNAAWIEVPGTVPDEYGVYYFRKDISLESVPESFRIHVSADQRYKLYVNGHLVSLGPARNDSKHWNYETVDVADHLKIGKNVFASQVWAEGPYKPVPNATIRTGFILMGEGEASVLDTDGSWKCIKDCGYTPIRQTVPGYYALGAGEEIDMDVKVSDWQDPENSLSGWLQARPFALGAPHDDSSGTGVYSGHPLVASRLPQLERFEKRMPSVRCDGKLKIPDGWPLHKSVVTIPPGKTVDILLDQKELTNGYFNLVFSGGKAAEITIQYAESLYEKPDSNSMTRELVKGNRNRTEGKIIIGRNDKLISNGDTLQRFSTLDWRTFRYVNLHVETKEEALNIDDVSSTFVGFPFKMRASIDSTDPELHKILEIGWRTARLCAMETYTDCPYYEQLQYLGDTRIQALVSLFNSGDDRLLRNYLHQADMSRNAEGITMGRAPSELPQYITPYALHYIYALHDYMMYGNDLDYVYDLVPGAEQIIKYFERYTLEDGRVSGLPGWNFTDWCYNSGWRLGVPQPARDGATSILDLQLLLAYQMLGQIETNIGNDYMAGRYAKESEELASSIQKNYWVEDKGLYATNSDWNQFSQHAQALAILAGLVDGESAKKLACKTIADPLLDQCSIYFRFYLHQALAKAGLGNDYLKWLDKWRENIEYGLTTWGETSDVNTTRSDCHAWGSSPNIEFYRIILGIDSSSPAFRTVRISPHLGDIREIGGKMPHPDGTISVSYKIWDNRKAKNSKACLEAEINLPDSISGVFLWNGKTYPLKGGNNHIEAL